MEQQTKPALQRPPVLLGIVIALVVLVFLVARSKGADNDHPLPNTPAITTQG